MCAFPGHTTSLFLIQVIPNTKDVWSVFPHHFSFVAYKGGCLWESVQGLACKRRGAFRSGRCTSRGSPGRSAHPAPSQGRPPRCSTSYTRRPGSFRASRKGPRPCLRRASLAGFVYLFSDHTCQNRYRDKTLSLIQRIRAFPGHTTSLSLIHVIPSTANVCDFGDSQ